MLRATFAFLLALAIPAIAGAQPPGPEPATDQIESLRRELEELRRRHSEEIEELEELVDQLEMRSSQGAAGAGAMAQALNLFNPRITVFGNMFARIDDRRVTNDAGDAIDNRILLREVEVDFRAAVDPYADGVIIVSLESEAPGEFETGIEEGYVTLKSVPGFPDFPLGLRLTAGRFRPAVGSSNRVHTHDLPQGTRAASFQNVLGEGGLVREGIAAELLLPTPGASNSLDLSLALLNGGDLPIAAGNEGGTPALAARLHWSLDATPEHHVDAGVSHYLGRSGRSGSELAQLAVADASYQWRPAQGGEWRSVVVAGELYFADVEEPGARRTSPLGFNLWGQLQLGRNLFLGARADYYQTLGADTEENWSPGVYLSYYTSEFLRLRAGYEHTWSGERSRNGLDTVFFEINFVFGSHPVEPYWVNR